MREVMDNRPTFLRIFAVPQFNMAGRALPADITVSSPCSYPVLDPRPLEHPQQMSTTVAPTARPLEPSNGSILV